MWSEVTGDLSVSLARVCQKLPSSVPSTFTRSALCDLSILCHLSVFKPCFKVLPELYFAKSLVNSSLAPTNQPQYKQKGINKSCVLEKFRSVGEINDQTNKNIMTRWAMLSQESVVNVYS